MDDPHENMWAKPEIAQRFADRQRNIREYNEAVADIKERSKYVKEYFEIPYEDEYGIDYTLPIDGHRTFHIDEDGYFRHHDRNVDNYEDLPSKEGNFTRDEVMPSWVAPKKIEGKIYDYRGEEVYEKTLGEKISDYFRPDPNIRKQKRDDVLRQMDYDVSVPPNKPQLDRNDVEWFKSRFIDPPENQEELNRAFKDYSDDPYVINRKLIDTDTNKTWIQSLTEILPNSITGSNIYKNVTSLVKNNGAGIALGLVAAALLALGTYGAVKAYQYITKDEKDIPKVPNIPPNIPNIPPNVPNIPEIIPDDPKLPPQLQSIPLQPLMPAIKPRDDEIDLHPQLQSPYIPLDPLPPMLEGNDLNLFAKIIEKDKENMTDHSLYIKQKIDMIINEKIQASWDWEGYERNRLVEPNRYYYRASRVNKVPGSNLR